MRTSSSLPWIVALSIRLYQWLLSMGPVEYRREYEEPTLQVFRQCCRDAYQQRGTVRVLGLWLPMFSEVVIGMLAEHFSAERMRRMLPTVRRSMIITFCAFILFGLVYIALQRIADPRPPFDAVASAHLDVKLAFTAIMDGADIAFLAIVVGGLAILFTAIKRAIATRRRDVLAFFGSAALIVALVVVAAIILGSTWLLSNPLIGSIFIMVFLVILLAGAVLVSLGVMRSEFSTTMLRFAIIPMTLTTLAMGVSFVATIIWTVTLWADVPQFAGSEGLNGPGLGGGGGLIVVVVMMALATGLAATALGRGFRARTLTPA